MARSGLDDVETNQPRLSKGCRGGEIHTRTGSCSPLPPAQNISVSEEAHFWWSW